VVVSSALAGGGFASARAIVNLHVPKNFQCADWRTPIEEFARRCSIPLPRVGLLTSAWTEHAEVAVEEAGPLVVLVVVTVGLGNPITAGVTPGVAAALSRGGEGLRTTPVRDPLSTRSSGYRLRRRHR
jgi:adenosylcobinamide amidohydrolase